MKQSILARIFALRTEETSRSLQLTEAKNRLAEVKRQVAEMPRTIHVEVKAEENPEFLELKKRLALFNKGLDALLNRYTEEHPRMKALRVEIAALEKQIEATPQHREKPALEILNPIYQQLAAGGLALRQEIKGHQAALNEIHANIKANEDKIREVVSQEKGYTDLMRQYSEYSEIYGQYRRSLVASRTRLEAEAGQYGTQVKLIQRALVPGAPYRVDRLRIATTCMLGGLGAGIALMFALEFCDHSLRSAEEAVAFLKLPVLAAIPAFVSPEERALRRRRRIIAVGIAIGLLAAAVLGLLLWEHQRPGTLQPLLESIRKQFI